MAKKHKNRLAVIAGTLMGVIIVLLVALLIYNAICAQKNEVPFLLFGKAHLKIETPSMEPTIPEGGYILVEKTEPSDVSVGDIIVFTSRDPNIYGILNTHRVIGINYANDGSTESFITKGDNNLIEDAMTTLPEDVRGKFVMNLEGLSSFEEFVTGKLAIILLLIIPLLSLAVLITEAVVAAHEKKREGIEKKLFLTELEKLRKNGLPEGYVSSDDAKTRDGGKNESTATNNSDGTGNEISDDV